MFKTEIIFDCPTQGLSRTRIMPRVSHNHGGGMQHFQASGRLDRPQSPLHRFPVQRHTAQLCLYCRECRLKFPIQGQVNILVDCRRSANVEDLSPDCRDPSQHFKIFPFIAQHYILGSGSVTNHRESLVGLFCHHCHPLWSHDARFFPRNIRQSLTEPLFVLQADWSDDSCICINDVRSVPASAHSDLNHCHIYRHVCKQGIRHDSHDFKEGQSVSGVRVLPQRQLRLDVFISLDELFGGQGGLVD